MRGWLSVGVATSGQGASQGGAECMADLRECASGKHRTQGHRAVSFFKACAMRSCRASLAQRWSAEAMSLTHASDAAVCAAIGAGQCVASA